jgi:hypothetical protein
VLDRSRKVVAADRLRADGGALGREGVGVAEPNLLGDGVELADPTPPVVDVPADRRRAVDADDATLRAAMSVSRGPHSIRRDGPDRVSSKKPVLSRCSNESFQPEKRDSWSSFAGTSPWSASSTSAAPAKRSEGDRVSPFSN